LDVLTRDLDFPNLDRLLTLGSIQNVNKVGVEAVLAYFLYFFFRKLILTPFKREEVGKI